MKMSEFDEEKRNSIFMVLLALKAYSLENNEVFSVDNSIIEEVIRENDENEWFVPTLQVDSSTGRTVIGVEFREMTDEEVKAYDEEYEDEE